MINIFDRALPRDDAAERGLIASVLIDPSTLDGIGGVVRAEDFYGRPAQTLYATLQTMRDAGESIDITLLVARLRDAGELERIGGEAYLAEIIASEAIPGHANAYARAIATKAEKRRMIVATTDALQTAFDDSKSAGDVRATIERALTNDDAIGGLVSNADGLADAVLGLDGGDAPSIATGFACFDDAFGGMFPGELVIVAGKTGGGKTAFAGQVSEHVAAGAPVLFVSLEMSAAELHRRRLARVSGVDLRRMRSRSLDADDRQSLADASASLSSSRLFVLDSGGVGVADIARTARTLKRKEGLGLIVIDYLQLLRPDDPRAMRERQVAQLSRSLKMTARDVEVPIILLAQLNRQADKDEEPRLSHLRESGAIEQDADVVAFVHRTPDDMDKPNGAKLIIAKHRHGQPQSFPLEWDGPSVSFREPPADGTPWDAYGNAGDGFPGADAGF